MKRNLFLLLPLIGMLYCCENNSDKLVYNENIDGAEVMVCNIDKITETRTIKMSELFASSELIKLSNDEEAILGGVADETYSNGHILLTTYKNELYAFKETGELIHKIDPGKGPGEFILPVYPQFVNNKIYAKDYEAQKLTEFDIANGLARDVKLGKRTGISLVLDNSMILTVGNSVSDEDPYLVCLQGVSEDVEQTVKAKRQVRAFPMLASEFMVAYPNKKGWNIHFPTNDTLMHYNIDKNELNPVAIFHSQSNADKNIKLDKARITEGLDIVDQSLTKTTRVVPEYENEQYYFLSIYYYGIRDDLPWYFPERKIALLDKQTNEAFFVKLINDFWDNSPFTPDSNSEFWTKDILQAIPAINVKEWFKSALSKKGDELNAEKKDNMQNILKGLDVNDNSCIFRYTLK